jgi:hypothetical protein
MSYGYSARVIKINEQADDSRLGVALGRHCIALDIPVSLVSARMGVSKQTVYNWFMGLYDPHHRCKEAIHKMITGFQSK